MHVVANLLCCRVLWSTVDIHLFMSIMLLMFLLLLLFFLLCVVVVLVVVVIIGVVIVVAGCGEYFLLNVIGIV